MRGCGTFGGPPADLTVRHQIAELIGYPFKAGEFAVPPPEDEARLRLGEERVPCPICGYDVGWRRDNRTTALVTRDHRRHAVGVVTFPGTNDVAVRAWAYLWCRGGRILL